MRARLAILIAIVQSILFLGHLIIYGTWIELWDADSRAMIALGVLIGFLSLSFVTASVVGFRYSNAAVRAFYRVAAAWLGLVNFLLCASVACWILWGVCWLIGWRGAGRPLVGALFGAAVLVGLYGMVNAARTRVKRVAVKLPNLPDSWRGRTAALVSDLHLGHVRSLGFSQKIAKMLSGLRPDVVFIAGDLYDGVAADLVGMAQPWSEVKAPFGAFFVAGITKSLRVPRNTWMPLRVQVSAS